MRADRLLSILLLLQTRGRITARKLAEMLEVSERTIYRDLDALSAAGVPVYAERGPGGGCALTEGYRTNLTGLSEAEIRSLLISGAVGPLADLGLGQVLEEALLKLLAALPSARRDDAERVRQRFMLDPAGWFQPREPVPHLALVQEAVWHDRKLHIHYRRSDEQQIERTIDPYGLVAKTSIWYLVGASDGKLRVYRVSRILSATLSGDTFERPPDFDLTTYWTAWCDEFESTRPQYKLTLRVAPPLIPLLPRLFGEGFRAVIERAGPPDSDGWITLPMIFESPEMACSHVLGFGTSAEVLDPPELRESVRDMALQIAALYGQNG